MQAYYAERLKAMQARATGRPRELQDLDARIDRLRDRLDRGDSDMTTDEIQTAIDRADAKRCELQAQQPEAVQSAQVLTMLPKGAATYRRQIELGLSGNDREALKARIFLRGFGGAIRLVPEAGGGLVAKWELNQSALLRQGGTDGSGGTLREFPTDNPAAIGLRLVAFEFAHFGRQEITPVYPPVYLAGCYN